MSTHEKSGYVAIVGRPNVGKSTLLNALIGKKISIVSPKPQTTRNQILGIKTEDGVQSVFIDTPGVHKTEKRAMNRYMNRLANSVIVDADVVLYLIEATRFLDDDELVLERLKQTTAPVILVINKIDLLNDKNEILTVIERMKEKYHFADIVPLSVKKRENIDVLEKVIRHYLPEGPHLFPEDQITDKGPRFQAAEVIREKLIRATEEELPYSTTVVIDSFDDEEKIIKISAIIWVEREGQKPIVIGKEGEKLKQIGTQARKELQVLFGKKIFLRLWVKVKDDWTDSERLLQSLGFE